MRLLSTRTWTIFQSRKPSLMKNPESQHLAEGIIKTHVLFALGGGLVPVPILDVVAVTAIQIDMLKQLARLYGVNFQEAKGKSLVSALGGSVVARYGASLVKAIPGIGSILGGISMSALSGASTYALGTIFNEHFASGGTMSDFNLKKAREIFEEEMEKGKQVVKEMEQEKAQTSEEDIVDKLEKLANLKEKGIISEEEFEAQKKRLLGDS